MSILSEYRKKHPKKKCASPTCNYFRIMGSDYCYGCTQQRLSAVSSSPDPKIRRRDGSRRENRTETKGSSE